MEPTDDCIDFKFMHYPASFNEGQPSIMREETFA